MKTMKIIFIIAVFIASRNVVSAQSFLGVRGGMNFSQWIYNSSDKDLEDAYNELAQPLFGGLAGGYYRSEHHHFAVQVELNWIQKGVVLKDSYDGGSLSLRTNINYLEAPVLFKGVFGTKTRFVIFAGPGFAYALNGHYHYASNGDEERESIDWSEDGLSRFDFSVHSGLGAVIPAGQGFMDVEARYVYGFANMITEGGGDSFHNSGFGISCGYAWPVKTQK
jgi:hypothetical protein